MVTALNILESSYAKTGANLNCKLENPVQIEIYSDMESLHKTMAEKFIWDSVPKYSICGMDSASDEDIILGRVPTNK